MGWGVWVWKGGCKMVMRDGSSVRLLALKTDFHAFMLFS